MYGEKMNHSYITGRNLKLYSHSGKQFNSLLYKSKYAIIIRPRNCTLGIYSREINIYVHPNICTWMFIVTLLIIAKN